jgi:hypothetical protein
MPFAARGIHPALPIQALALGAGLAAAAAGTAALGAPADKILPWTVGVEVFYTGERNREAYRQELQARTVQTLVECDAFRNVVAEGESDLLLSLAIDRFDVEEEREFQAPPTGGPGEMVVLGCSVTIGGTLTLTKAGGAAVVPPKKFYRQVGATPVTPQDDARWKALEQAYDEPLRWVRKYVCRRPEDIRRGMLEAGAGAEPRAPQGGTDAPPAR